jgi:hypothetical protein
MRIAYILFYSCLLLLVEERVSPTVAWSKSTCLSRNSHLIFVKTPNARRSVKVGISDPYRAYHITVIGSKKETVCSLQGYEALSFSLGRVFVFLEGGVEVLYHFRSRCLFSADGIKYLSLSLKPFELPYVFGLETARIVNPCFGNDPHERNRTMPSVIISTGARTLRSIPVSLSSFGSVCP